VFPYGDFDTFIGNVERLSGTAALRHDVHELRMRLLRVRCGLLCLVAQCCWLGAHSVSRTARAAHAAGALC